MIWFQHTAARRRLVLLNVYYNPDIGVSTHSRPKAAGINWANLSFAVMFQHTAARRRLEKELSLNALWVKFQHTAARRRLVSYTENRIILK